MRLLAWRPFVSWSFPFPRRTWGFKFLPWDQFGKDYPDFDMAVLVLWRLHVGFQRPAPSNTASDGVKTAEPPVWHCPDCALPFDTKRPHCGSAAHYRNDEVRR